ncbi:MAG: Mur ligase family protein [Candidatus Gracilibacteria bacterium]|nr:Mur ligase family protein [Candidatus Gracilibacteria bacterium]
MKRIVLKIIYNILAKYTRAYLMRTKPFVIGITGNVGKTSCRMILHKVLHTHLKNKVIYTSPKNFNSELGLICSIFKIEEFKPGIKNLFKLMKEIKELSINKEKEYDIIILEYGIDRPRDMDFLLSVVKPDISIFTKLGSIHVQNFGTKEKIGNEKIKLIFNTKYKTYLNFDDEYLKSKYKEININKQYFNKGGLKYEYKKVGENIISELKFDENVIKTNMLGTDNFAYLELSYTILGDFGKRLENINEYIELENQPGRFNVFSGLNDSILIDSSYNAGPESMKQMIENVRFLRDKLFSKYKIGFVIGDMRELGKHSKELHKQLYLDLGKYDLLLSVGTETSKYFPDTVKKYLSSVEAGVFLKDELLKTKEKYIILFKGSQNTIFVEEALKQVLADKNDEKKLVRQDDIWIEKKSKFY